MVVNLLNQVTSKRPNFSEWVWFGAFPVSHSYWEKFIFSGWNLIKYTIIKKYKITQRNVNLLNLFLCCYKKKDLLTIYFSHQNHFGNYFLFFVFLSQTVIIVLSKCLFKSTEAHEYSIFAFV